MFDQYKQDIVELEDDYQFSIFNQVIQDNSSLKHILQQANGTITKLKRYSIKKELIDFVYQESKIPFVTFEDIKHVPTCSKHLIPIKNAIIYKQKSLVDNKKVLSNPYLSRQEKDLKITENGLFDFENFKWAPKFPNCTEVANPKILNSKGNKSVVTGKSSHSSFQTNVTKVYNVPPINYENGRTSFLSSNNSDLIASQIKMEKQKKPVEYKELYSFKNSSKNSKVISTNSNQNLMPLKTTIDNLQPLELSIENNAVSITPKLLSQNTNFSELIDFGMIHPFHSLKDNIYLDKKMFKKISTADINKSKPSNILSKNSFKKVSQVQMPKNKNKSVAKDLLSQLPSPKVKFQNKSKITLTKTRDLNLDLTSTHQEKVNTSEISSNYKKYSDPSPCKAIDLFPLSNQDFLRNIEVPLFKNKKPSPTNITNNSQNMFLPNVVKYNQSNLSPLSQLEQLKKKFPNLFDSLSEDFDQSTFITRQTKNISKLSCEKQSSINIKPTFTSFNSELKNSGSFVQQHEEEKTRKADSISNSDKVSKLLDLKDSSVNEWLNSETKVKSTNGISSLSSSAFCDHTAFSFPYPSCDNNIKFKEKKNFFSVLSKNSSRDTNAYESSAELSNHSNKKKVVFSELDKKDIDFYDPDLDILLKEEESKSLSFKNNNLSVEKFTPEVSFQSAQNSFNYPSNQELSVRTGLEKEFFFKQSMDHVDGLDSSKNAQNAFLQNSTINGTRDSQKNKFIQNTNHNLPSFTSLKSILKDDGKELSPQQNKLIIKNKNFEKPYQFETGSFKVLQSNRKQHFLKSVSKGLPKNFKNVANSQ